MIHITSDTHYSHKQILGFESCDKYRYDLYGDKSDPESVERMNAGIIKVWNDTVKPGDTVYHLGDVCLAYGKKEEKALYSFLEQVNGDIILLNGNHDSKKTREMFKEFGHTVGLDYLEINSFETKIVMSHYPHGVWNKCHHGAVMLHGHSHGSYSAPGRILDVGWDVHGRVLTLKEAYDIAMSKPVTKTDHH